MSFGDDIRIIARTKELTEKIDKALKAALAANKAAIEGKRAIAYLQANGVTGTQNNGSPGNTTLDDADDDGIDDLNNDEDNSFDPEEDSETPDDPNNTDPSNNATDGGIRDPINNPAPGTYSANELIDGAIEGAIKRLAISEGDGKGNGKPGSRKVNTIYGKDQYGNDVYINTHGIYDSVDGWPDPNTPPEYDGFQLGYYWRATNPATGEGSVPELAAEAAIAAIKVIFPDPYPAGYGDALMTTPPFQINESQWDFGWKQGPLSPSENIVPILRVACTTEGVILCPSSPPTKETIWSLAGNYALAYIGGLFTPSPYDSEVPPIKKNVTSSAVFDLGDGRFGVLRPARGGGHVMYEVDAPFADANPTEGGTGLWFRNDWTLGRFIPNNNIHRWTVPDS